MDRIVNTSITANYAELQNTSESIKNSMFGGEILGWDSKLDFTHSASALGYSHLRWPGGLPAEDGIDADRNGHLDRYAGTVNGPRRVYDLTNENVMDWVRVNGAQREGLSDVLEYAKDFDMSFSMIIPTAKYVEMMNNGKTDDNVEGLIREEVSNFIEKLATGGFGTVPTDFTLEIGSEYYATETWKDLAGRDEFNSDALAEDFGKVFAVIVSEIDNSLSDLNSTGRNSEGFDPKIAVQAGRLYGPSSGDFGNYDDNRIFAEALADEGALSTVDSIIYHRYVSDFDHISHGLSEPIFGHTLEETEDYWSNRIGSPIEIIAGWNAPNIDGALSTMRNGAPGLTQMLELFAEMAAQGVDYASLYSIGNGAPGSYSDEREIFIGGQLYGMMIEALPNKFLNENSLDGNVNFLSADGESVNRTDVVNKYAFESSDKTVIYLASSELTEDSLTYELSLHGHKVTSVSARSLTVPNTEDSSLPGSETNLWEVKNGDTVDRVIGNINDISSDVGVTKSGDSTTLRLNFSRDYELIELTVSHEKVSALASPGGDTLESGTQGVTLIGGPGDDTYRINNPHDVVVEKAGEGLDHVDSSVSFALRAHSQHIETLALTGTKDINATGNGQANTIYGNDGNNVINGAWGNDTLFGGAGDDTFKDDSGADRMIGGTGDDTYRIDNPRDVVVERAGEGLDHVDSSVSFALRAHSQHIETLALTGAKDINATGNGQANTIYGNDGNNVINGAWGNDTLFGGAGDDTFKDDYGADRMIGGTGDDTYRIDNSRDVVVERAGGGLDHVDSSVSFALRAHGQHIETLSLIGAKDINATGNSQANTIYGNDGNNVINGARGNDTLFGGAGNDIFDDDKGNDYMTGGDGSDLFIFRGGFGRDVITDFDVMQDGDRISLRNLSSFSNFNDLSRNHLSQAGDDAIIDDDFGNTITLLNVNVLDLEANDFLF